MHKGIHIRNKAVLINAVIVYVPAAWLCQHPGALHKPGGATYALFNPTAYLLKQNGAYFLKTGRMLIKLR